MWNCIYCSCWSFGINHNSEMMEVPGHQSNAEVPLSKVPNLQKSPMALRRFECICSLDLHTNYMFMWKLWSIINRVHSNITAHSKRTLRCNKISQENSHNIYIVILCFSDNLIHLWIYKHLFSVINELQYKNTILCVQVSLRTWFIVWTQVGTYDELLFGLASSIKPCSAYCLW